MIAENQSSILTAVDQIEHSCVGTIIIIIEQFWGTVNTESNSRNIYMQTMIICDLFVVIFLRFKSMGCIRIDATESHGRVHRDKRRVASGTGAATKNNK